MNRVRLTQKLRHFLAAPPQLWPDFLRQWNRRQTSGLVPCVLPGSKRVLQIPAKDYYESYWFFCESVEGRRELRFFCDHLRPNDVFFDIGGFRGVYSLAAHSLHGEKTRVIAFEPLAPNAKAIRRIVALNQFKEFELIEAAVGNGGQLAAEVDPDSVMVRSQGSTQSAVATHLPSLSLDHFCTERGLWPNILKLDVDGFELSVLNGATQCITEARPRIWLELHPGFLAAQGTSAGAVKELLQSYRYRIQEFSDAHTSSADISYHIWAEPIQ